MSLSANNLERRSEYHDPYYRRFEVSFYCRVTHCSSCGYRVASHRNGRIECCSIMCSLSGYTSERRGAVVGAIRIVGTAETPSASLGRFLLRPPLNFSDGGRLVRRLYSTDGRMERCFYPLCVDTLPLPRHSRLTYSGPRMPILNADANMNASGALIPSTGLPLTPRTQSFMVTDLFSGYQRKSSRPLA